MSSSISRSEAVAEVLVALAGMPEECRQEFIKFFNDEERKVWFDLPCSIPEVQRVRFCKNGGLGPNGSCMLSTEARKKLGEVNNAYYETVAKYARELYETMAVSEEALV